MQDKGLWLVIGTAVISGFSVFLNAFGVKGLDPFAFAGVKNLLVALALLSLILLGSRLKEVRALTTKDWRSLVLIGLVGGSIPFLLFFKGLSMGNAATAGVLHKTLFVWVILGAALFLQEKVDWRLASAAILLLAGNVLLLNFAGVAWTAGLWYILGAVALWTVEILLAKRALQHMAGTTVAAGRMGFGAGFILLFLLVTGRAAAPFAWSGVAWGWVALTSVLLLGYVWTFYNGLKTVKAGVATSVLAFGTLITTLLQLAFADAALTPLQIGGAFFFLAGAFLLWRSISVQAQRTSSMA
jgi:drug/metabolite transporter (DMT)-like permease